MDAREQKADGTYRVRRTVKLGGDGGFDWPIVDATAGKLYIPRSGDKPHISIFDLATLKPAGEISGVSARNVAIDSELKRAFAASSPVAIWDTGTGAVIKRVPIEGKPAGIMADALTHRIFVQGRSEPGLTVLDAKDGAVLGTLAVGGEIEQSASDGAGLIYVDIEDRQSVVVIDAKAMEIRSTINLDGVVGKSEGMALDTKNHVLFVASRDPQITAMIDTQTGKVISRLPIGKGCSAAAFNPKTMECFFANADGTLTIIKEKSPTEFVVEQTVTTLPGTKRLSLDSQTGRIYLITAEYAEAAAPTAGAKPGAPATRGSMKPGSFTVIVIGKD